MKQRLLGVVLRRAALKPDLEKTDFRSSQAHIKTYIVKLTRQIVMGYHFANLGKLISLTHTRPDPGGGLKHYVSY